MIEKAPTLVSPHTRGSIASYLQLQKMTLELDHYECKRGSQSYNMTLSILELDKCISLLSQDDI